MDEYTRELADIYSHELACLKARWGMSTVTDTGGRHMALWAPMGNYEVLATNGDGLVCSRTGVEPGAWYIGIYHVDSGDQVAEGESRVFIDAYGLAIESLERGDFNE